MEHHPLKKGGRYISLRSSQPLICLSLSLSLSLSLTLSVFLLFSLLFFSFSFYPFLSFSLYPYLTTQRAYPTNWSDLIFHFFFNIILNITIISITRLCRITTRNDIQNLSSKSFTNKSYISLSLFFFFLSFSHGETAKVYKIDFSHDHGFCTNNNTQLLRKYEPVVLMLHGKMQWM